MRLDRARRAIENLHFRDFPSFLRPGDVLTFNDSRVIPARLRGRNHQTGGEFELLLLEPAGDGHWWSMVKPGKRARIGTVIDIVTPEKQLSGLQAIVRGINEAGHRRFEFTGTTNILNDLERLGEIPLPPYIHRSTSQESAEEDAKRYQTVYANAKGSLAAPTAGLHFTTAVLDSLRDAGVILAPVTLHVGLGTFAPVKAEHIEEHPMHEERFDIPASTASVINAAKREGRRVLAVGTTSLRVLESVGRAHGGLLQPGPGRTRIFIYPPSAFSIVDGLLTNFHLPRSTLLMLVSAFAAPEQESGRPWVLQAYREAVQQGYRFFSYGDAMLIT